MTISPERVLPGRETYNTAEMAAKLGVTEETVRRMLRRGEMPGRRIAGIWMAYRPTFDTWLREYFT